MSRRRRSNDLIRIEDAIKVMCRRGCHPGVFCPDAYCKEMWELLEDVERVDAVPVAWIEDEIKELKEMDNSFSALTANLLSAMLRRWKEREGNEAD